ncbi:MAG: hypothetical protein ABR527_07145 [Gemmatimonadota bacterium]
MHRFLCACILAMTVAATTALPALAQEPGAPAAVPADPADVESIDAILVALYDVISGPAGERDWDRFRSLFATGATLAPAAPRADGTIALRIMSVEDFIGVAGEFFSREPFYEVETGRHLEQFGNVASAMSGYASRRAPDEEPFSRGVNAITLLTDGSRWYVLSIAWDVDREGNPLPEDLAGGR